MSEVKSIEQLIEEVTKEHEERINMLEEYGELFGKILTSMPQDAVTRVWVDNTLNVSVSGDKLILTACIRAFRTNGFSTEEPLNAMSTSYCCYFRRTEKPSIWFSFTSKVCRRVKVGTKMVEQDVYETICDEPTNKDITPPQRETLTLKLI